MTPTPVALLLNQLFKLKAASPALTIDSRVLNYQLTVLVLILLIGIISLLINYSGYKTYQSEDIVEWNFSLLMHLYFAGYIFLWKKLKLQLQTT